jgi:protoheme IX farnesyltransferase
VKIASTGTTIGRPGPTVAESAVVEGDWGPLDAEWGGVRSAASPSGVRARAAAFWELTKPGITRLVLVTTAVGFYLASDGALGIALFLNTLFGTALAAAGSGVLNQYLERDADARMRRTAARPLPSGRVSGPAALRFGVSLSVLGVAYLALFTTPLASFIVALTIVSYLWVYTPLKRRTWLSTIVGAVPGALPIVAGWAAAGGALDVRAGALFAIMFVWQLPHFFALAWVYREDYTRGGFRMLTADDPEGRRTGRHVLGYCLVLLPLSLAPAALGMAGPAYVASAVALGAVFIALAAALLAERTVKRAWRVFFASVVYLPALLLLLVLDRLI